MTNPLPPNEAKRLAALQRYRILDTAAEAAYDDIVRIASYVCATPIALVSLVDNDRQWFKARVGLEAVETPREQSFCAHAILQSGTLIVEDATKDERFAHNPLVTGEPGIRFYAGAPLVTHEGHGLGSLCVIDRESRQLDPAQIIALEALARMVVTNLEFRRTTAELAEVASNAKTLAGLLPICIRCKNIRNDTGYWQRVESYVKEHSEAKFTMELCPACASKHLPKTGE